MRCMLGCERSGAPLHRFPNPGKFPEQFKAWMVVVGGNPEDYLLYVHKRICHIHFKKEDWNRNNRLNALAVPSLHLPMWCSAPDAATKVQLLTLEKVGCAGPSSTKPVPEALDDNKCRLEPSAGIDLITAVNILYDEHNYASRSGLAPLVEFTEPPAEVLPSSLAAIKHIKDEHSYFSDELNYASRPGLTPLVEFAEPPAEVLSSSLAAIKHIKDEHNYLSKPSRTVKRGKRTSHNGIPSHQVAKLQTCVRQVKNKNKREILRLRKRGLSFKARLENALKLNENVAFQTVTKNMTDPAKIFTQMQSREGKKKPNLTFHF